MAQRIIEGELANGVFGLKLLTFQEYHEKKCASAGVQAGGGSIAVLTEYKGDVTFLNVVDWKRITEQFVIDRNTARFEKCTYPADTLQIVPVGSTNKKAAYTVDPTGIIRIEHSIPEPVTRRYIKSDSISRVKSDINDDRFAYWEAKKTNTAVTIQMHIADVVTGETIFSLDHSDFGEFGWYEHLWLISNVDQVSLVDLRTTRIAFTIDDSTVSAFPQRDTYAGLRVLRANAAHVPHLVQITSNVSEHQRPHSVYHTVDIRNMCCYSMELPMLTDLRYAHL